MKDENVNLLKIESNPCYPYGYTFSNAISSSVEDVTREECNRLGGDAVVHVQLIPYIGFDDMKRTHRYTVIGYLVRRKVNIRYD